MRLDDMVGIGKRHHLALLALVAMALVFPATSLERATGSEPWTVRQDSGRRVPVVMIVLDELPLGTLMTETGRIDHVAFPNFARLATSSTWFRNATTPAGFSLEALPAILRGVPRRVDDESAPTRNLFTLLGDRYPVRSAGTGVPWCEPELCNPHDTEATLPADFHLYSSANRGRDVAAFLEVLGSRGPSFRFLHLLMPHGPLRYLPTGQRYLEVDAEPGEVNPPGRGKAWGAHPWLVKLGYQRHFLQTMLTDRALGLILDRLESTGTFERSLLVVLADHGLGFVPTDTKRVVTPQNLGHVAYVPMFVKPPGQHPGEVSDVPVETTDVAATVADVLDLSEGPVGSGRSMFSARVRGPSRLSGGIPVPSRGQRAYDLVRSKYAMFGKQGVSVDPYSLAPTGLRHLIGDRIEDHSPDGPPGLRHLIGDRVENHPPDGPQVAMWLDRYEDAHPSDSLFPALLEGRVLARPEAEVTRLAIAVNGRIAAVTQTSWWRRAHRFFAMLDPHYFTAPPNDIEIYEVADGSLRLAEIHPDAGLLTDALVGVLERR